MTLGPIIRSGVVTDPGSVRDHNEDAYLVRPPLFVVADGMGGHAAGEVASRLAIEALAASALGPSSDETSIEGALATANRTVLDAASGSMRGMGTTCAVLLIGEGVARIANVGDSRVYRLREGELEQLSRDHTLVAEMVDQGLISAADAMKDDVGGPITRALGGGTTVAAETKTVDLRSGDRFLLCSDGLSRMIPDDEIRTVVASEDDPQHAAQTLVDAAKAAGGDDNVTVIVVHTVATTRSWKSPRRTTALLLLAAVAIAVVGVALAIQKFS